MKNVYFDISILEALVESADITNKELAKIAGVSRQLVEQWFDGKSEPKIRCLIAICNHFGVSLDYFTRTLNEPIKFDLIVRKDMHKEICDIGFYVAGKYVDLTNWREPNLADNTTLKEVLIHDFNI